MKKKPDVALHIAALFVGIPAVTWLIHLTDWRVALAICLLLTSNNLNQRAS